MSADTYVLSPGVELPDAADAAADVVYVEDVNRYVRVGPGALRLLRAAGEPITAAGLTASSGRPLGDPRVIDAIARLELEGLLVRGDRVPKRPRRRRFRVLGPFMVQFDLLEPTRFIDLLARGVRALGVQRLVVAMLAVLLAGAVGSLAQLGTLTALLHGQVSLAAGLITVTIVWATTFTHELAHGLALRLAGGVPRRIGIMLFYGVPGLYCDISDAWRVKDPRARAAVCLAGILTQATGAALCALGALATSGAVHDALLLAMLFNGVIAVGNLLPFLKLDGYLAIVSLTGQSDLRAATLGELKRGSAWLLVGGERPRLTWGRAAFAIGCAAVPVMVIAGVADAYNTSLRGLGAVGAALQLMVSGLLLYVGLSLAVVFARALAAQRPTRRRAAFGTTAAALALFLAALYPVGTDQVVPFVVRDGQAFLAMRTAGTVDELAGRQAQLYAPALLPSEVVGGGRVGSSARMTPMAIDAGSPVRSEARLERPTLAVPLIGTAPRGTHEGIARVAGKRRPLAAVVYERGARDPLRVIWSEVSRWM
jgi:putative peptide zinc metalloprotease protein